MVTNIHIWHNQGQIACIRCWRFLERDSGLVAVYSFELVHCDNFTDQTHERRSVLTTLCWGDTSRPYTNENGTHNAYPHSGNGTSDEVSDEQVLRV